MDEPVSPRSGFRIFSTLLLAGQRVDFKYSLVVILVITGMFSTPLALGSIRNRVYAAVREQIEKENNARELTLHAAREEAPPLDEGRLAELRSLFSGLEVVGDHRFVVSVEGPEGEDFLTLQTLRPGDPRSAPLGITPALPADFGLHELVISDALGRLLYGEGWEDLWSPAGTFSGAPLTLRINDLPIAGKFRAVARRTFPGRGLYASPAAGAALRRYTEGLGAPELGLPADPELVELALPRLVSSRCLLLLAEEDPSCGPGARERLRSRLRQLQCELLAPESVPIAPSLPAHELLPVGLAEVVEAGGHSVRREILGNCQELLAPHLVETCNGALVVPVITLPVLLQAGSFGPTETVLAGAGREVRELLAGAAELRDRLGVAPARADGPLALTAPLELGLEPGRELYLGVVGPGGRPVAVPARVESLYRCAGENGSACPLYTEPLAAFRLENLRDGTIRVQSEDPLVFEPMPGATEFDEILAYVPAVETVEAVAARLGELYPGYEVGYNVAALDKLRRQDSRLSTLFTLTIVLSALFIVLALGALARINIERRGRQMAQMLILGFSRRFVRRLIVAEYLLLSATSALLSVALTTGLCALARLFLRASTRNGSGGQDFAVIVDSMGVDLGAFLLVFAVVTLLAGMVAVATARKAARTDPLNLLD